MVFGEEIGEFQSGEENPKGVFFYKAVISVNLAYRIVPSLSPLCIFYPVFVGVSPPKPSIYIVDVGERN